MITHDLGVVAEMCDRAAVMYCGSAVEEGPVHEVFKAPSHPYTRGLMMSIPKLNQESDRLYNIKGSVPSLFHLPEGCRFADRCEFCTEKCKKEIPPVEYVGPNHTVKCHHWRTLEQFSDEPR